jgi:hypothetical protein
MPPATSRDETNRPTEPALAASVWDRIKAHLLDERHRIAEEIKNYPRPIPACDLQFNHLLERRASLSRELARLDEAAAESLRCRNAVELLDEFLRSASHMDDAVKERFTASLKEGLSGPPA